MPSLSERSVNLILADLPYGTTRNRWDTVIDLDALWAQYRRLLTDDGAVVLTACQPFTSRLVMSNPKWFRYEIVWDKVCPTGFLDCRRRPMRRHENILVFSPRRTTYHPQMTQGKSHRRGNTVNRASASWGTFGQGGLSHSDLYYPASILRISNAGRRKGQHPTSKPLSLFEYLVETYSNPGDCVLDNCMGHGTTGVACQNTGRRFIGIELDTEYFEAARRRIGEDREAA